MTSVITYVKVPEISGLAHDTVTGESVPIYVRIKTEHQELSADQIDDIHNLHLKAISKKVNVSIEKLEIVTKEEYENAI